MAKTTINIEVRNPDDTPAEGFIYFRLATADSLNGVEYHDRNPLRINLDNDGLATVQLQPNDDPGWSIEGNSYLVEERFAGKAPRRFYMVVPTSVPALDYADLATYGNAPTITANIDLAAEFAAFEAAANATYALKTEAVIPQVVMLGTGIDWTGATDSTTAIQAKIDAAPQGALIYCPAGVLKFSSITLDEGKRLIGSGWQFYRDAGTIFGDATYLNTTWYGGTLLKSTATSGAAITAYDTDVTGTVLKGFMLIGPGSGTSVGIDVGTSGDSVVNVDIDVGIVNFSLGLRTQNTHEGTIKATIRGCTKGATFGTDTNTLKIDLNVQRATDGASTHTSCLGLTFLTPIFQSLTGTGLSIEGTAHTILNPYFESSGGVRAVDFVSGTRHTLITPSLNTTPDRVRVQAACVNIRIIGTDTARVDDSSTTTLLDRPRAFTAVSGGVGFENSWANVGAVPAQYRLCRDNKSVEIIGSVTGGAAGTTVFTLPAECRPYSTRRFFVANLSLGTVVQGSVTQNGYVIIAHAGNAAHQYGFTATFPIDAT
jgi:hypothetical protein